MAIGVVGYTTRFRSFNLDQLKATYKKIADLGYSGPEGLLGGRVGLTWEEDWKLLQEYGLKIATSRGDLENPDEAKKRADALGVKVMGLPAISPEMWHSANGFKAYADKINGWAKNFKGYKLQYHNHAQEFRNFPSEGGKTGLAILIEGTDPDVVCFEIDTFWTSAGGADPAQWILKVKNRIPVVHFKDYAINWNAYDNGLGAINWRFAEIGQGNINWPAVAAACKEAGVEWYCVEQDQSARDEFESLKMSITYIKGLGIN